MKILIVEDEVELLEVMIHTLSKSGYIVDHALDYKMALDMVISYEYDCILLDITLPGGNGMDLLSEIVQKEKGEAVIIVSAKNSVGDRITGLQLGADDYISKPFHLAEMVARVSSAIRRRNHNGMNWLKWNNIKIYPEKREVTVDGEELSLTKKEFDILYYLIINQGRIINKISISEYVWGDISEKVDSLDFLYSHMKNLRRKLSEASARVDIQAVYGIGYKITGREEEID